jgi:hypothetical protein
VESADEKVPSTVTSYAGGNTYNNFDTSSIMYSYTADDPDTAKEKVEKYAGRINGGDFSWTFTEADDTSYAVNTELKAALRAYKTSFVCIAGTDGLVDTDTSTGNEGSSGGSFGGTTETTTDAASTTTGTTGTTTGTTAGTATETTTQAPVSKTYTFDAASESVITGAEKKGAVSGSVGTDGFFTLTGTVTRSNSDKFSAELGKQESGALEFTVAEGADVTFAVSSTGSSNSSDMVLVDASGNRITPKDAKDAVVVLKGSDSATVQYTNLAAGTYKLVSPSDGSNNTRGFRVYSAAVTQTTAATSTEATKPEATTGTTETTKPEATTGTTTETTKPEVTTGTTTETTKPEAATGTTTETTKPEAATGTTTETTKPEATAPETTPTEAAKPDTTVSDTAATDVVLDNTSVENAQVTVVESGSGAPEMKFAEEKANVLSKLLTAEEVIAVNSGAAKVSVSMKVEAVNADDVKTESEAIKEKVSSLAEAETIGMYFDITVEKNVGGKAVEVKETPNGALSISMELPKSLLNADSSKTRSYSVVRYHVDTQTGSVSVDILPCSFADGKITFESDKFSVYAVIYSDSAVSDKAVIDTGKQEVNNSADTASSDKTGSSVQTGDKVSLSTIMLLLGLLLFSVAIITALVKRRKKEN